MRTYVRSMLLAVTLLTLAACASHAPLRPVSHVDLPRYMGDWHVIGVIPYFAEKDCVDSIESYALRPDGDIDNGFQCRKKSFDAPLKRLVDAKAVVTDRESNSTWKVHFFSILRIQYVITDLDAEYQWVAVAHPSRKYGWIMARQKTLPDAQYQAILKRLGEQDYDTSRFRKVPQQAP